MAKAAAAAKENKPPKEKKERKSAKDKDAAKDAPKEAKVTKAASSRGKGAKSAAGSGGDSASDEETILSYLRKQNRPFSAIDVFNNLHGAVGKTAVQNALKNMASSNTIVGKQYGNQWVFVVKQNEADKPSQEELDQLDDEIASYKEQIQIAKDENKQLQTVLAGLQSSLPTEEIVKRLAQLSTENQRYEERLQPLRSGENKVTEEDKKRIDTMYDKFRGQWKKRKRLFYDMIGMMLDGGSQKPKDFMEELGIETDEMMGVDVTKDPLAGV